MKLKEFSMKKSDTRFWFMITFLALGTLFLAACSGSPSESQASIDSDTAQSEEAMMDDEEGDDCAECHGETGDGDGPIAAGLDIKPATLSDDEMMTDLSDAYVFWRITMGGAKEPFNSTMPSFLFFSEEQRWQLVSFVRSLPQ
jgi:mono/diheme cytochrome c family protein